MGTRGCSAREQACAPWGGRSFGACLFEPHIAASPQHKFPKIKQKTARGFPLFLLPFACPQEHYTQVKAVYQKLDDYNGWM